MKVDNPGHPYFTFNHEYGRAFGHRLPGNGTVIVFTHSVIRYDKRGRGYGAIYHRERLTWARRGGFTSALCTVNVDNVAQIRILKACGWMRCGVVIPCDECQTESHLWMKDLSRPDEGIGE